MWDYQLQQVNLTLRQCNVDPHNFTNFCDFSFFNLLFHSVKDGGTIACVKILTYCRPGRLRRAIPKSIFRGAIYSSPYIPSLSLVICKKTQVIAPLRNFRRAKNSSPAFFKRPGLLDARQVKFWSDPIWPPYGQFWTLSGWTLALPRRGSAI